MVLMNATKRARNISSTVAKGDNHCNGGMKKAGSAPTAGWMRKLNGVKRNYYFSRTHQRNQSELQNAVGVKTCPKQIRGKTVYYLGNANQMPRPFSTKRLN